jgi:membrane protein insertase Oxa1/YidC/SpoIIIJ
MVNYIIESIAVGLYSLFIFYILSQTTTMNTTTKATILLFTTGFVKHLLGNVLQIHDYYCNHGAACSFLQLRENQHIPQTESHIKYISQNTTAMLILECIIEGIIFVILYNMILYIFNQQLAKQGDQSTHGTKQRNNMTIVFLIGFILHVLSEKTGIHTYFCKTRCKPSNK